MEKISLEEYSYNLPPAQIAQFPLDERDASRLLYFHKDSIEDHTFRELPDLLPSNARLIFNDTKVIPARLYFRKESGAQIEVFLLHPVKPSPIVLQAMESTETCTWKCTIGNLKRWKTGTTLTRIIGDTTINARLLEDQLVEFTWKNSITFSELLLHVGQTPLPPYLNRQAEPSDKERYQTIYSHYDGAVAAPTAGLHFTPRVIRQLEQRNIEQLFLTLHVSAGTFQPIKTENAWEHQMHSEQIVITREVLEHLLDTDRINFAVGTTSVRTLESLYWYGVKMLLRGDTNFSITQEEVYTYNEKKLPSKEESLNAVLHYMKSKNRTSLVGETCIYIVPGYQFKMISGLITNFHQPGSTLILLVAAFVGKNWRTVYNHALTQGYRFLSFGDSSLLMPNSID